MIISATFVICGVQGIACLSLKAANEYPRPKKLGGASPP